MSSSEAVDLGTCMMCEQEPATETWFVPVCNACGRFLDQLHIELTLDEVERPDLAALAQEIEDSWYRVAVSAVSVEEGPMSGYSLDEYGRQLIPDGTIPPMDIGWAMWRGRVTQPDPPCPSNATTMHDESACLGGWVPSGEWWLHCGRCRPY